MKVLSQRFGIGVLAVAFLLGSAACAQEAQRFQALSGGVASGASVPEMPAPPNALVAPSVPGKGNSAGDAAVRNSAGSNATAAAPASGVPAAGVADSMPAPTSDRMIVYTTEIALTVNSVADSVTSVTALAEGLGGYVSSSSSRVQGDKDFATIALRVPSSAYSQAMTQLRKMGVKVTSENGSSRDVTEDFADLGAQVKNLQATEAQLQALMAQAKTVDEILKVQSQLTQVRGQIERLQGRMNVLQKTSDMATITVNLSPVVPGSDVKPSTGWDPLRTVRESWDASMAGLIRVVDVSLRVGVTAWWVVALALLGWGVYVSKRRGKRAAAPAGPAA